MDAEISAGSFGRCPAAGESFPHKRLMGMCCWMGLHFLNWSDYNGVANFRISGGSRDPKWENSRLKKSESCNVY